MIASYNGVVFFIMSIDIFNESSVNLLLESFSVGNVSLKSRCQYTKFLWSMLMNLTELLKWVHFGETFSVLI